MSENTIQNRIVEFLDGPFKLDEGRRGADNPTPEKKIFRFRTGRHWYSFSEKDIDEFLDKSNYPMYTSSDNLPKWIATGIMSEMGAKNIKGKVQDAMFKVLKNIKSGKIKEIDGQRSIHKSNWK